MQLLLVKKGDLVEFKPGTFGIDPPNNLGIVLDRYSKKKTVLVQLMTVKGKQEAKVDKITKRKFNVKVDLSDPQKAKPEELKARLIHWIKEFNVSGVERKKSSKKLSERALWEKAKEREEPLKTRELAQIWFEVDDPSPQQLAEIDACLSESTTQGVGFFEKVGVSPVRWQPLAVEDYKKIMREIEQLSLLRKKMLTTYQEENEEGELETRIAAIPLEEADLDDEDWELLNRIQKWMAENVEKDSWSNIGLAGTSVHTLEGFSLPRYLKWLAEDWTGLKGTSYANAFIEFLLRTGFWTAEDALNAIAKRKVRQYPDFNWETPDYIERIAQRFEEPNDHPELWENRVDLRDLETYTIDPPTAKDFDDAISFEQHSDGTVTLWVHIADVSEYVEKDSSLDLHAYKRATSVYLPVKVLPMLPSRLSDDLCSLREQLVRLAMTIRIDYDKDGNRVGAEPMESIIFVKNNLSYDQVNEAIEKGEEPFASMSAFADKIWNKRLGLDIETAEARLEFGSTTGAIDLAIKHATPSTRMIEAFMVAANEAISEYLEEKCIPTMYRCHPLPDKENVEKFNHQAVAIGLETEISLPDPPKLAKDKDEPEMEEENVIDLLKKGGKVEFFGGGLVIKSKDKEKGQESKEEKAEREEEKKKPSVGQPITAGLAQMSPEEREQWLKPFNDTIHKIREIEDEQLQTLAFLLLLRVLGRAIYTAGNIGHFGLGSVSYTHFTSPIRRYPDLIIHRLVKSLLRKETSPDDPLYSAEEIEEIAQHCTDQSVNAEILEREVVASGIVLLARQDPSLKQAVNALVTGLTSGGIFIMLRKNIEGKIPMHAFTTEKTFIDEYESMLFAGIKDADRAMREINPTNWKEMINEYGEAARLLIKLGDRILVQMTGSEYVEGKITAVPV